MEDVPLWVGSHADAISEQELAQRGIHAIVNAAGECEDLPTAVNTTSQQLSFRSDEGITVLRLGLPDHCDAPAAAHFLPTTEWIASALERGIGVLIHCRSGISRGPTFAMAALMLLKGLTADDALEMVRKVRPHVNPNLGFTIALQDFESKTRTFREFASQCRRQAPDLRSSTLLRCYRNHGGHTPSACRAAMALHNDTASEAPSPDFMARILSVESEGGLSDSGLSGAVSAAPPIDFARKAAVCHIDCHVEAAFDGDAAKDFPLGPHACTTAAVVGA